METSQTQKLSLENLTATYNVLSTGVLPTIGCEKCENGHIKLKKDGGFGWSVQVCDCQIKYDLLKQQSSWFGFDNSNIRPSMLSKYPIAKYDWSVPLEFFESFVKDSLSREKKRLYFYGGPGTGKTYSAMVGVVVGVCLGCTVLYANVPKLMDDLRPNEKDEGKLWMERCIDADILVLDDIGQEKCSERVLERLYIIINERYINDMQTIFTSNFSVAELLTKIKHPAIISRIKHLSIDVNFGAVDKRPN